MPDCILVPRETLTERKPPRPPVSTGPFSGQWQLPSPAGAVGESETRHKSDAARGSAARDGCVDVGAHGVGWLVSISVKDIVKAQRCIEFDPGRLTQAAGGLHLEKPDVGMSPNLPASISPQQHRLLRWVVILSWSTPP